MWSAEPRDWPGPDPPATFDDEVANTEVRTPGAVVLDLSGSMKIVLAELEAAFQELLDDMCHDELLAKVVDFAVVGCSGDEARVLVPFARPANIQKPEFVADGKTPLYQGVLLAVREIENYRENTARRGIDTRPPMVIVITDGNPTDHEHKLAAIAKISQYEKQRVRSNRIGFFFFASTGGNIEPLQKLSHRKVQQVSPGALRGIMQWILASMDSASRSGLDEAVLLPDPKDFRLL